MNGTPSIRRRPASEKSNVELVNSLRSNLLDSKQAFASALAGETPSHELHKNNIAKVPYTHWTAREKDLLYVPSIDFGQNGLAEESSQYDITVKLFFLPNSSSSERFKQAEEALDLVLKELQVPSIDLLIVSFPGVSFDSDIECEDVFAREKSNENGDNLETMIETWRALELLHRKGLASRIGVAEFGSDQLKAFLSSTQVRPSVDQISVKDCCVVPAPLVQYAKQENIELLTHNDCTNILPSGTIRELLGNGEKGAGMLIDSEGRGEGLQGDIRPQWVTKYTAVIRDRGVIENKGYFAMAEICD